MVSPCILLALGFLLPRFSSAAVLSKGSPQSSAAHHASQTIPPAAASSVSTSIPTSIRGVRVTGSPPAKVVSTRPIINAIIPTTAGQIGINPADYTLPKVTVNTGYLTEVVTATITKSGGATSTTAVPLLVTATVVDGKLNIVFAPSLMDKITTLAESVPACGAKKKKKRQLACGLDGFLDGIQMGQLGVDLDVLNAQIYEQIVQAMGWAREGAGNFIELLPNWAELYAMVQTQEGQVVAYALLWQVLPVIQAKIEKGIKEAGVAFSASDVHHSETQPQTNPKDKNTCPKPNEIPASCQRDNCKGDPVVHICSADGKNKGCPCVNDSDEHSQHLKAKMAEKKGQFWAEVASPFGKDQVKAPLTCQSDKQYNISVSMWNTVASMFCAGPASDLTKDATQAYQLVDKFSFGWSPNDDTKAGKCKYACADMFNYFTSDPKLGCRDDDAKKIFGGGTQVNVCGTAKWGVSGTPISTPPPPPPSPSPSPTPTTPPQYCYPADKWPDRGPIDEEILKSFTGEACDLWGDDELLKSGLDPASAKFISKWAMGPTGQYATYTYAIAWSFGTQRCNEGDVPGEKRIPKDKCQDLMYRLWKDCNNGGSGGSQEIGCVNYSFRPWKYDG